MSYYGDSRYRAKRDRYSRPGYGGDTYVDSRGVPGGRQIALARRHDDTDDSVVEEVTRDFPPGEYYSYHRPRRVTTVQEGVRRARSMDVRDPYYDEEYYRRDDYRPRRSRRFDDRRDRHSRYSSYSSSRSPSSRPRRRKSLGEQALGAIGGVLGVNAAKRDDRDRDRDRDRDHRGRSRGRDSSHRRHRSYSYSGSRSRSRGRRAKSEQRVAQAVKAALTAGAAEAFRARNDPGPWTGDKGKRILTAAISAGGVDGLIDRNPDKHEGRHMVESVLAGLATNHLVNGSRSKSKSRGRGRSQSRSGLKDVAATGILAAAGKQLYDRVRSKSRGRSRSSSRSSYDSDRRQGRGDSKTRSSSVSAVLNKGLAALGLEDKASKDRHRHRKRSSRYSDEYSDYSDDDDYRSRRHGRSSRDVRPSQAGSSANGSRALTTTNGRGGSGSGGGHGNGSNSDSDSDLGCSDDDKQERKKMLRNEMLTTGLATVASIHAAHSVLKGIEGRKKRREELKKGEITPEEARKRRRKADLMDVATVGLAALGVKGAIGEWQEVNEKRKEHKQTKEKFRKRHEKRILKGSKSMSNGGSRRALTNESNDWDDYQTDHNSGSVPHYHDGNPYGGEYPSVDH